VVAVTVDTRSPLPHSIWTSVSAAPSISRPPATLLWRHSISPALYKVRGIFVCSPLSLLPCSFACLFVFCLSVSASPFLSVCLHSLCLCLSLSACFSFCLSAYAFLFVLLYVPLSVCVCLLHLCYHSQRASPTLCIRCVHSRSSLCIRCVHSRSSLCIRCVHSRSSLCIRCVHSRSSLCIRCVHSRSSLCIRCVHSRSSLFLRCVHSRSSLCIRCVHTRSTLTSALSAEARAQWRQQAEPLEERDMHTVYALRRVLAERIWALGTDPDAREEFEEQVGE